MANEIKIRRDTASNWTAMNPILNSGELGYEIDTSKLKIGNGSAAWNSLSHFTVSADSLLDTTLNSTVLFSSLTSLGTITEGVWNGTLVSPSYGGTGVSNNPASTLTINGNYSLGVTLSGNTLVTLPTNGKIMTSDISGITGGVTIINMVSITAAAFALITPDASTLYFIKR